MSRPVLRFRNKNSFFISAIFFFPILACASNKKGVGDLTKKQLIQEQGFILGGHIRVADLSILAHFDLLCTSLDLLFLVGFVMYMYACTERANRETVTLSSV